MPFIIDLNDPNPELPMAEALKKARARVPSLDFDSFKLGYLMAFELMVKAHHADRLRLDQEIRHL